MHGYNVLQEGWIALARGINQSFTRFGVEWPGVRR